MAYKMYRRPRFLEILLKIREEMAREADYDVDFYVEMIRSGIQPATDIRYRIDDAQASNGKASKTRSQSSVKKS